MAIEIHKVRVRTTLKPRREPYWGPAIGRGQSLGFRKIDALTGSWVARMRDEHGRKSYKALGFAIEGFDYEMARAAAMRWFANRDAGVTEDADTVADACKAYVTDRGSEKGAATARDAQQRFERTVYGTSFASIPLDKLRTPAVKKWRDGLHLSKAASNRTLTALKAALNLAVRSRRVSFARQVEWAEVKPFKNATKRRSLFLDLNERRSLVRCARADVGELIQAAVLTGARPGELVAAERQHFDARKRTMTFSGKTGTREVALSEPAVELFSRLAHAKTPRARLLVRGDGKPWAHSDWDELVKEAAAAAELPQETCLYTLRHSFISQAISDGMTTLEVSRLVGTSLKMIEQHYGQLADKVVRERLARVRML